MILAQRIYCRANVQMLEFYYERLQTSAPELHQVLIAYELLQHLKRVKSFSQMLSLPF